MHYTLAEFITEWKDKLDSVGTLDAMNKYEDEMEFGDMPAYTLVPVKVFGDTIVLVYRNNGQVPFDDGENLSDYIVAGDDDVTEEDMDEAAFKMIDPGAPYATFVTILWNK